MPNGFNRRQMIAASLAPALVPLVANRAGAQAWPARAVTMVVPYGPGASNDTFTRALAEILSKKHGQPFVVENRAGAGGFTGTNSVVRAAPDGYTFLEVPNSVAGFRAGMKVDFDPMTSLTPVAAFARSPTALVVNASLPIKTTAEFIAHAKANPGSTFYGFAGIGTAQHQHMEQFIRMTGISIRGVNYKSSADAQADLVAGRLQAMIITIASTIGQINAGQLRLISYTNDSFPASSPKAPTMAQDGVKGMEGMRSWWGLFGPPKLPAEIVKAMNAAINEAVKDPAFVALLARSGATPLTTTPESFAALLKEEIDGFEEFFRNVKT